MSIVENGSPQVLHEQPAATSPDPSGASRFRAYMDGLRPDLPFRLARTYPDLPSRPWHDASQFPIVQDLVANYAEIRREARNIPGGGYHREAERINRRGSWDVFMLYERGRRSDQNCRHCPLTTSIVEAHDTVRTQAGIIYFSRLRPGTHIAPHRGPTNMRLRCHLGLEVPDGDLPPARRERGSCSWRQGECIVFDDTYEHEAWNYTGGDRVVLIVDLWHSELTAEEIRRLRTLHRYASAVGQSVAKYWAANARARRAD